MLDKSIFNHYNINIYLDKTLKGTKFIIIQHRELSVGVRQCECMIYLIPELPTESIAASRFGRALPL